ncbi:MAG: YihY/virulence factor BrkB family protein [Rhodanobacteraceae bacterium]
MRGFLDDNVMSLAASLSFYTLLSFAPLLVLAVWSGSLIGYDAQQTMLDQLARVAGPGARAAAQSVFSSADSNPHLGSVSGIVGIAVSLVAATTVFAQLQAALNRIWGLRARPGNAVLGWLRRRVLSIGVIASVVFVLIVSLVASSLLGMLLSRNGAWWDVINQLVSTGVFAILFALLFRYLPDGRLPWQRVLWGGVVTAILFAIGKWLIGFYLSSGNVGSAYGAASSLVLLLVWVYYSGAIFFFGAEVVQAWAIESGEAIEPEKHAEVL